MKDQYSETTKNTNKKDHTTSTKSKSGMILKYRLAGSLKETGSSKVDWASLLEQIQTVE